MRAIMLSWEYPPKIVGGISRHVYDLAHALVRQGTEVHVITCEHGSAPAEETDDGVYVHRVTPETPTNDFVHWVHRLNDAMVARANTLIPELLSARPDEPLILHPHDWLAYFSAAHLKHTYGLPMIATIHATENGRNNGIHTPIQHSINYVEWQLQFEAWRVITCSDFMRRECERALGTPWSKMDVIYNGVEPDKFVLPGFSDDERAAFRSRYALPHEKIIFFVGRMVREKGVQVLIEALPKVRTYYNAAKLVIVGGGHKEHLVRQAAGLGVEPYVCFTGYVSDEDLLKIYGIIDIACYPSLYEPFGIVALEAMAAHVPVVASDAGGLTEIVQHDVTGVTTYAGNANSLADGLLSVLHNPDKARRLADAAAIRLRTVFNWDLIAQQTGATYQAVWNDFLQQGWGRAAMSMPQAAPAPRDKAAAKSEKASKKAKAEPKEDKPAARTKKKD